MPPDYPVDPDHPTLKIEMLEANGRLMSMIRMPAPLHKNDRAAIALRISVEHHDHCSQVIKTVPLDPY